MCDIASTDWHAVSHAVRIDGLVALQGRIGALQAELYRLLAIIDADPATTTAPSVPGCADKNWAVEDVACALRVAPATARSRLAEAAELVRLPETAELLADGAITLGHARVLIDATMPMDDATASAVQRRVLSRAAEQSIGAFRQCVRRAVLAVDARTVEMRYAANVAERRVCIRPAGEGTSELWALLPDEGAASIMTAVTTLADSGAPGDSRTADQRRADALVQLGADWLAGDISRSLPRTRRMRPAVQVTVALSTLIGLDEQPAELAGVGPVSAEVARRIAADASGTWRRLVTDPVGRLIEYGRSTYRPPADLSRFVTARDVYCRFPHCGRSASRSELDHTRAWANGGSTDADNLVALCKRHHHLRHDTAWSYTRNPITGDVTWRSPTGHLYIDPPAIYPIDESGPADRGG